LKNCFIIFIFIFSLKGWAQRDTSKYDRLEEIIHNDKRYALHNNYLQAGFGFGGSNLRSSEQAIVGIDYVFHIKRQHFQIGFLMSGDKFLSNNNLSGHLGYCYRIEDERRNIAFTAGISQNKGAIAAYIDGLDTIPELQYRNTGIYVSASYVKKLTYDIGIGLELIGEVNQTQRFIGVKGILFFSGAYRGKAKIYNRHVKTRRK
jgi:UDP-glucose 6-dehydrogenase